MKKPAASKTTEMILQPRVTLVSLLFLLFYLLLPSPSRADSPTEQVRATVDKVLTIVRNPNLKSDTQHEDLRAQLAQVIYPRFDFTEMAKRSLGPHWGRRTSDEKQEFVKTFTGLLAKSYVDKIESYGGDKVLYGREVEDMNYAEVNTKIFSKKGEVFSINYKLHSVNNEWRVYDLVIENISLVNNYRSQFHRVIVQSSFEDLVRIMKEKQSPGSERSR